MRSRFKKSKYHKIHTSHFLSIWSEINDFYNFVLENVFFYLLGEVIKLFVGMTYDTLLDVFLLLQEFITMIGSGFPLNWLMLRMVLLGLCLQSFIGYQVLIKIW